MARNREQTCDCDRNDDGALHGQSLSSAKQHSRVSIPSLKHDVAHYKCKSDLVMSLREGESPLSISEGKEAKAFAIVRKWLAMTRQNGSPVLRKRRGRILD